jgi:stage II sporulation protein P
MKNNISINNNLRKIAIIILIPLLTALFIISGYKHTTYAALSTSETNYLVYDEDDKFLFERISVEVGDIYISKNFKQYQVYVVNQTTRTARAKFIKQIQKPNITKKSNQTIDTSPNKKIALYLTHNAESYLIGDGTDSIYGKGGIHDIANKLSNELKKQGVNVELSENLHLPHNSLAYSRSKVTAEKLLNNKPDAIFDIHRDGVSRQTYAKVVNGQEKSMVRIVVGQANPNKNKNLAFAMWLLSVAETTHPWLFLDIYFAKGHYNQNLLEKSLLFEMGTYTIEKDLVIESVEPLANVIYSTLYATTINNEGDLVIGGEAGTDSQTINQILNQDSENDNVKNFSSAAAVILFVGLLSFFIFRWRKTNN